MIHPDLTSAIEQYENSSGEDEEYNDSLEKVHLFFQSCTDYQSQINLCIKEFEDNDLLHIQIIIESLYRHYSIHKEKLIFLLNRIFESSTKNHDDFHLLHYVSDFNIEMDENTASINDVYETVKKYILHENEFVKSAAVYLLSWNYKFFTKDKIRILNSLVKDLLNHPDWKVRYMTYSYFKSRKIDEFNINITDKVRGFFINGIETID